MSRHRRGAVVERYLRAAHTLLDGLGLPAHFALHDLHDRLEQRRGRRIHLIARHMPTGAPHGLWVAGQNADYVFYPHEASAVRRTVIIGHEYGHIIADDTATPSSVEELAALLLPQVDATVPAMLLSRTVYEEATEQRAELFGTVVAQRAAGRWDVVPRQRLDADPEVLARMTATLEAGPQ
jgi:hypothetical protein